ncbi:MAG: hypothetical protein M9920_06115 [Verrucomicrobiae bacterium]|nr:hypothetical protein [Verrucomicrobiae bacterium]
MSPYKDFTARLKLLIGKNPRLVTTTLSNIFTMRLIGNKTHGDLAEIAIAEFINQFMYDFKSVHVGKDLYRAKEHEEDIKIINEITKAEFPVSLKAYGDGPLQLSTDKNFQMFPKLQALGTLIEGRALVKVWNNPVFAEFGSLNVLPLIYDEKKQRCNILVFDSETARNQVTRIALEEAGHGRKHPVFRFYDGDGDYVCEVRYGSATANALQRGLWTHTKNGLKYFESVTNGWIDYAHNLVLVKLFSLALVATSQGHAAALKKLKQDIEKQKKQSKLA